MPKQSKSKKKPNESRKFKATAAEGALSNLAFIYWNDEQKRHELKIDNKLKGYSQGDHEKGAAQLKQIAEEKGYRVV